MRATSATLLAVALLTACAAKTPPATTTPALPSATAVAPAPADSADVPPGARCARGELAVCAALALARARSIHGDDQRSGRAELKSLCDRGLADACAHWGDFAWDADRTAGRAAYERGCALGSARGCALLAVVLDDETPGSPRAHELFTKSCDAGAAEGCTWLALTMRPKEWKEPDIGTFWALVTRGCVGRLPQACRMLGVRESTGNGIPRDAKAAARHFEMACDGRDADGCTQWGLAQSRGAGTAQDDRGAARAFGMACDEGKSEACVHLANAYARGAGVAKDTVHAAQLLTAACTGGARDACLQLARDVRLEASRDQRLASLDALCTGGTTVACQALGQTLRWIDKDEGPRAVAKLELACAKQNADACLTGYYATTAAQRKKKGRGAVPHALEFLDRSCDRASPGEGCVELAEQWLSGEMVPRDATRGATLAIELCEGHGLACATAGGAHARGTGTTRDLLRAVTAYTKGCDGGLAEACRELAKLVRTGQGVEKSATRADELQRRADELSERDDD